MRYLLSLVTATLLGAVAPASGTELSKERLTFLMDFAAEGLGVTIYKVELPRIIYVSQTDLMVQHYGAESLAAAARNGQKHFPVRALYAYDEGIMLLDKDVDHANPDSEYLLVHELVHHVQRHYKFDVGTRCYKQLEQDAYRISNLWVLATGKGERKDGFTAFMLSLCEDDE